MIDKEIKKTHQKEDKDKPEPLNQKNKRKENNPFRKFLFKHGYKIEFITFPATLALVVWLSVRIHASLGQVISLAGICFGIYHILLGLIARFEIYIYVGFMAFYAGIITFHQS